MKRVKGTQLPTSLKSWVELYRELQRTNSGEMQQLVDSDKDSDVVIYVFEKDYVREKAIQEILEVLPDKDSLDNLFELVLHRLPYPYREDLLNLLKNLQKFV